MNTRFEFEKARDFGAVIGDALQFFAKNFKSLLLGFLIYVGPFLLLGILAMVSLGNQLSSLITSTTDIFPTSLLFLFPTLILATMMVWVFVCAAVEKYQQVDEPIGQNSWPYVRRNLGPGFVAMIVAILIFGIPAIAIGTLAFIAGDIAGVVIMVVLVLPVFVYLSVPVSIFLVLHILEKNPVLTSLKRAFALVQGKWWITFAIYIVVGLLAGVASYILSIPAYILMMIMTFGAMDSGQIGDQFGIWMGIMYALSMLGSLFAGIYQILGVILQYYNLREQKEGHGLMRRIQSLDQPEDLNLV